MCFLSILLVRCTQVPKTRGEEHLMRNLRIIPINIRDAALCYGDRRKTWDGTVVLDVLGCDKG